MAVGCRDRGCPAPALAGRARRCESDPAVRVGPGDASRTLRGESDPAMRVGPGDASRTLRGESDPARRVGPGPACRTGPCVSTGTTCRPGPDSDTVGIEAARSSQCRVVSPGCWRTGQVLGLGSTLTDSIRKSFGKSSQRLAEVRDCHTPLVHLFACEEPRCGPKSWSPS